MASSIHAGNSDFNLCLKVERKREGGRWKEREGGGKKEREVERKRGR